VKSSEKVHSTQKPDDLFIDVISTRNDWGFILDPFLGSGTTAVACERLGRKWIGIEISEQYCELAAKRIEAEAAQLKLFA
jgi:DNA modification methylase